MGQLSLGWGGGGGEDGTDRCTLRPQPAPSPKPLPWFHHLRVMQEAQSQTPVLPSPRELPHIWSCSWALGLGPVQGRELAGDADSW